MARLPLSCGCPCIYNNMIYILYNKLCGWGGSNANAVAIIHEKNKKGSRK